MGSDCGAVTPQARGPRPHPRFDPERREKDRTGSRSFDSEGGGGKKRDPYPVRVGIARSRSSPSSSVGFGRCAPLAGTEMTPEIDRVSAMRRTPAGHHVPPFSFVFGRNELHVRLPSFRGGPLSGARPGRVPAALVSDRRLQVPGRAKGVQAACRSSLTLARGAVRLTLASALVPVQGPKCDRILILIGPF
jgi:hypothetical protein